MKKKITINPVTRLEGEAKIEIFLDEKGDVDNAFFQVVELRGFEKFCEGRLAEEMPRITSRICGVCPGAHHVASTKALDGVFGVEPTAPARSIREIFYCAHLLHSHIAHFYVLSAPDFIVGSSASAAERNILGLIGKVGLDIGKQVITARKYAQDIQSIIGGKATHPTFGLPGGVSRRLSGDEISVIRSMVEFLLEFCMFGMDFFDKAVLSKQELADLILGDVYRHETYYMGLVDGNNCVNFYDGTVRVVDQEGGIYAEFPPRQYLDHIAERVEPWSYLKFPYLKNVGWKGLKDGKTSGVYRVNSLARLNAADGMATPRAQEAYEKMFDILGGKPSHATLAFNWARLVEMIYASERILELIDTGDPGSEHIRNIPERVVGEGIGCIEAPRGTLFHHYWTDEAGIIKKLNLIVATGQNNAGMCMSIKKAAQELIHKGKADDKLLNMVEMAFRAYDPCLACATHVFRGRMPLSISLYNAAGERVQRLSR